MEAKTVRPEVIAIQTRFFQTVDLLIESKKIKNLSEFCTSYGLHRPKYSNLRTRSNDADKPGTGYKLIDIDALAYLVKDYGVSAEWLLIGKGGMFRR